MDQATLAQTLLSIWLFLVFIGFLIWALRTGQFKNVEEPKYRMFDEQKSTEEPANPGQAEK